MMKSSSDPETEDKQAAETVRPDLSVLIQGQLYVFCIYAVLFTLPFKRIIMLRLMIRLLCAFAMYYF